MFLHEGDITPGLYLQADGAGQGGVNQEPSNQAPMESLIPKGAKMPKELIPADTQVDQVMRDAEARARGELIELFG